MAEEIKRREFLKKLGSGIAQGAYITLLAGYALYSVGKLQEEKGAYLDEYYEQLSPAEIAEIEGERGWAAMDAMQDDPKYWKAREAERQAQSQYEADRGYAMLGYIRKIGSVKVVEIGQASREELEDKLIFLEDLSFELEGLEESSEDVRYFHMFMAEGYEKVMQDLEMAKSHYQKAGLEKQVQRISKQLEIK